MSLLPQKTGTLQEKSVIPKYPTSLLTNELYSIFKDILGTSKNVNSIFILTLNAIKMED